MAERDAISERFQLMSRVTNEGMWDWNIATGAAWWSDSYYCLFGLDRSMVPSFEAWLELVHPDDRERVAAGFARVMETREPAWTDEYRHLRADGSVVEVVDRGCLIFDEGGTPIRAVGVVLDMTQQRALERQFRHAQKMEAIGQLAGGVAHDFNNVLQAIALELRMLESSSGGLGTRALGNAHEIRAAVERAKNLTRQLLVFSRREAMQPQLLDLNERLGTVTRMLRRVLGEDIYIEEAFGPGQIPVEADPSMLDQELLNMAVNARDAMRGGGRLTISTRVVEREGRGRLACVTVRDTGAGIAAEVLPHIFEPFFTTKDAQGTGLGLATVHGIVEQHRGWVEVESAPGEGTAFHVFLPAHRSVVMAAQPESVAEASGGRERILVVEDDGAVRRAMCALLADQGYQVLAAESGATALATWDEHQGKIDLVVTDLVMPGGIHGRELAARLGARTDALRLIYVTGHARDLELGAEHSVLHKPVDPDQLLRAIRSSFDRA